MFTFRVSPLAVVSRTSGFSFKFIVSMGRRKLRNGTKKNYEKIASGPINSDGEPIENENVSDGGEREKDGGDLDVNKSSTDANAAVIEDEQQKQTATVPSSNNSVGRNESEDDAELESAQERLRLLKQQQRKLLKEEKLKHVERETEELEKQLKRLNSKKNKPSDRDDEKPVTVASLRGMRDVVEDVDKLMDSRFNLKAVHSSDESSETSDSSSDSSTDSDSDSKRKRRSKKKKSKSGSRKHRSGKSKKLTSYVQFPQKWPHSHLSLHFVSKEKKYEDLSIAEFCAGYIAILETSPKSKNAPRVAHLKELMYLATKYQWRYVLNYHAACLMEIERGHLKWGDSFQLLQSTTLAGGILSQSSNQNRGGASGSGTRSVGQFGKEGGTVFCRFYQRGTCPQTGDHQGIFNGETRLLRHICAKCWLSEKKVEVHPETSADCPSK